MTKLRSIYSPRVRIAATVALTSLLFQLWAPTAAVAGGAQQPEFSSRDGSANADLVDPFTGSFQYGIPVVDLPGAPGGNYTMNLNYQSGSTPYQDISWVGSGWSLSPGAITRQKSGLPDDYNGEPIITWNKGEPLWGLNIIPKAGIRAFASYDDLGNQVGGLSASAVLSYNNTTGWDYSTNVNLSAGLGEHVNLSVDVNEEGVAGGISGSYAGQSAGAAVDANGDPSFSLNLNPGALASLAQGETKKEVEGHKIKDYKLNNNRKTTVNAPPRPMPLPTATYTGYTGGIEVNAQANPVPLAPVGYSGGLLVSGHYKEFDRHVTNNAYGQLYHKNADNTGNRLLDYHKEKDGPYHPKKPFKPMPLVDADQFSLSAPGIGGSLELSPQVSQAVAPSDLNSTMVDIGTFGVNIEVGGAIGVSPSVKSGYQETSIEGEMSNGAHDEGHFMRFTNDLAVQLDPDIGDADPTVRTPRASVVSYHTNGELQEMLDGQFGYKGYTSPSELPNNFIRGPLPQDGIGEVAVLDGNGTMYDFALPVYARNEVDMSYSIEGSGQARNSFELNRNNRVYMPNNWLMSDDDLINNNDNGKRKNVRGQIAQGRYATAFLLTALKAPNYTDRTNDGPSPDDFGAWVRYGYKQLHGHLSNNWFQWRSPYLGFHHSRGQEFSRSDDVASMSSGQKEIYYLNSVYTKTHAAVFYTSEREDQLSAFPNELSGEKFAPAHDREKLHKLDSVAVFTLGQGSINADGNFEAAPGATPLRTTYLEYDYSLCGQMPHNSGKLVNPNNINLNANRGVLTLKRVWTEHNGVKEPTIYPYVFAYEYTTDFDLDAFMPNGEYDHIENYAAAFAGKENPAYNTYALDRWGHPQDAVSAPALHDLNYVWNDQRSTGYDPGAWQMKQITLPNGSEIHIQYDEHQYASVHGEEAMIMAPLSDIEDASIAASKYYLDLAAAGIDTQPKIDNVLSKLKKRFSSRHDVAGNELPAGQVDDSKEKLYFKFLFEITTGDDTGTEYFEALCNVYNVGTSGPNNDKIWLELGANVHHLNNPQQFARSIIQEHMMHRASLNPLDAPNGTSGEQFIELGRRLVGIFFGDVDSYSESDLAPEIIHAKSVVRIPIADAKSASGPRVKRVLMYDPGVASTNTDNVLYGQEYRYELPDGTTSGVAANEPRTGKYENPLYNINELFKQQYRTSTVGYHDLSVVVDPIGETLLPGASIGYSRVVQAGLYGGKTNLGHRAHEFYTFDDEPLLRVNYFPVDENNNAAATETVDENNEQIPIDITIMGNSHKQSLQLRYELERYNIHGKPKSTMAYRGLPDDLTANASAGEFYEYHPRGAAIATPGSTSEAGKVRTRVQEKAKIQESGLSASVSAEFVIGQAGIIVVPLYFTGASIQTTDQTLETNITTEVTTLQPVVKTLQKTRDGIVTSTQNSVHDAFTAAAVVTASDDEFYNVKVGNETLNKRYYAHSYPAFRQYEAMGPRYNMEGRTLKSGPDHSFTLNVAQQRIVLDGTDPCAATGLLTTGDLLLVKDWQGNKIGIVLVESMEGNVVNWTISQHYPGNVWPVDGQQVDLEIFRSARTNQLNATVGKITTYQGSKNLSTTATGGIPNVELLQRAVFANQLQAAFDVVLQDVENGNPAIEIKLQPDPLVVCSDSTNCDIVVRFDYVNQRFVIQWDCFPVDMGPVCSFPNVPGTFSIAPETGELLFVPSGACQADAIHLDCITFCNGPYNPATLIDNVVSASAITMQEDWVPEHGHKADHLLAAYEREAPLFGSPFEYGLRGNWHQDGTFAYRTSTVELASAQGNRQLYDNVGVYNDFTAFNWQRPDHNSPQWLETDRATLYTPDGVPVETANIFDVPKATVPTLNNTLTGISARNAEYNTVLFEPFETAINDRTETGFLVGNLPSSAGALTTDYAHTGTSCVQTNVTFLLPELSLPTTGPAPCTDVVVRFWASQITQGERTLITDKEPINFRVESGAPGPWFTAEQVAVVGEWTLFQAVIEDVDQWLAPGATTYQLRINQLTFGQIKLLDDLKIAPLTAESHAAVYDLNNFRLLASFGDSHFATLYQYNDEGQLLRKRVETERGIKTVEETHKHRPGTPRNPSN